MRKFAAATLGVLALAATAVVFLLTTTVGLRWTVNELLLRSGTPVEIGAVSGRLLGPASFSDVTYRDPASGTRVHVERMALDWRPGSLFSGLLHVTRLDVSGVEYTPGSESGDDRSGPPSLPDIALPVAVRVDALRLERLTTTDGGAQGRVLVQRASLRVNADGNAVTLTQVSVDAGRYVVDQGRIRLELTAGLPLEASLDWRAVPPDLPAFNGALSATGSLDGALESEIDLRAPFTASVRGTISDLLATPRWSLTATVPQPVALDAVASRLPPLAIQGKLEARGDTSRARLEPDLALVFQGIETGLQGELELSPRALVVHRARLTQTGTPAAVELAGRLGLDSGLAFTVEGQWQSLQGPGNAAWASRSGEFRAEGDRTRVDASVSGTVTPPGAERPAPVDLKIRARGIDGTPRIAGSAKLPYFAFGGVKGRDVSVDVDYDSAAGAASDIRVEAASLVAGGRQANSVTLEAQGSLADHRATLKGNLEEWSIETEVAGSYREDRWQGELRQLTVAPPQGSQAGRWALAGPTIVTWSPAGTEVDELCMQSAATRVCGEGRFAGQSDWRGNARLAGLPLDRLARETPEPLRIEGTVEAEASVGNSGDGLTGDGRVVVDRATVAWEGEDPVSTTYRDLVLEVTLDPAELRATLDGTLNESGALRGQLVTKDPLEKDGSITGSISANLPTLRLVQAAVPALGLQGGRAELKLNVDGTRSTPRLSGDGRIEQATLDVEPLGIQLRNLHLDLSGDDRGRMNIAAGADAGEGTLTADGFLAWPADGGWRAEIDVGGEQAQLVRLPKAVIDGSPELELVADQQGGRVEGRILITRAELTPDAGRPQVTISRDIVVKGEETGPSATQNPMAWHARVAIELGGQVRFRGYGLRGGLTGALEVDAPPAQPIRANGNIRIENGQYSIYGRRFDVERGRIVYTGGPIDNPGIDVALTKETRDVSVSLAVTGPLMDPRLQLSSDPAMSETDKMSYLLLGRPASQASEAEAGLLLRAASSLLPGGDRGIPSYVQSTLGLDTLQVRTDSAETEGASVELGKYLAPDLYVSYVAGFQQAVDIFRVRYELARHWLLQAESTTRGSGGDLLFTW